MKICLISANPEIQSIMKKTMYALGTSHTYMLSTSGVNGLNTVINNNPDYIFLDIALPETDGFIILSKIKAVAPKSKIIVLSVIGNQKVIDAVKDMKVVDYVVFPVNYDSFNHYVKAIVSPLVPDNEAVRRYHPSMSS